MKKHSKRTGFTLIELLLVIAIITVLVGILLPVFAQARKQARMASCRGHLRQLGMALSMYASDYGQYPNPLHFVKSVQDRRLLRCPEDPHPEKAASSYAFRTVVPPAFKPYWETNDLDPNLVLIVCKHHQEKEYSERLQSGPGAAPRYPFRLVLRASGAVQRVPEEQVRQVPVPNTERSTFVHVYPQEPFYTSK